MHKDVVLEETETKIHLATEGLSCSPHTGHGIAMKWDLSKFIDWHRVILVERERRFRTHTKRSSQKNRNCWAIDKEKSEN